MSEKKIKVEAEKAETIKPEELSVEDRRDMINAQLENALKERDRVTTLIFKCQGALELLDSIEKGKND
tara:strand:+ start:2109 stop:2312 length:204 start_codon:yes stop_codon:yes gene_type:complete